MNANELANLLEVDSWYKLVTREEIATMLRQQQAEIEALKNKLEQYEILEIMITDTLQKAQEKWINYLIGILVVVAYGIQW